MNNNIIYFYATLGDMTQPAFGGGEVGNRRTIGLFRQIGYKVVPIPKYARHEGCSFSILCRKIILACKNLFTYMHILSKGNRKDGIVHIAGFSGSMVYWTLILIYISKFLGYKTVYELRGGGIVTQYHSNGTIYRFCFNRAVHKADCIFSQGEANKPLIMGISPQKNYYYYPNYVEKGFSPELYPTKPKDALNLIYFGRLSHTKNIEIIIDVFNEVSAIVPIGASLTIIGAPENDDYFNIIKRKIDESPYKDSITLQTRCPHDILRKHLADKHFFIFPTRENGEGHSNAMTEAMAWGIIPVATNQGFNKDVIDCNELIVDDISKESISEVIIKLFNEKSIDQYSQNIFNRAKRLYSYEAAIKRLALKYNELFNEDGVSANLS